MVEENKSPLKIRKILIYYLPLFLHTPSIFKPSSTSRSCPVGDNNDFIFVTVPSSHPPPLQKYLLNVALGKMLWPNILESALASIREVVSTRTRMMKRMMTNTMIMAIFIDIFPRLTSLVTRWGCHWLDMVVEPSRVVAIVKEEQCEWTETIFRNTQGKCSSTSTW